MCVETQGYSYGSLVLCPSIDHPKVPAAAAISYPFGVSWFLSMFDSDKFLETLQKSEKPKFFAIG
jgi:hypothetical protein